MLSCRDAELLRGEESRKDRQDAPREKGGGTFLPATPGGGSPINQFKFLAFTPTALYSIAQCRVAHAGLPINQMTEPQRGSTKGAEEASPLCAFVPLCLCAISPWRASPLSLFLCVSLRALRDLIPYPHPCLSV